MLHPSTSRRERILLYGLENGGKSTVWNQIAQWSRRTNSPSQFFVMDSDMVAEWAPDAFSGWDTNVRAWETYLWKEYPDAYREIVAQNDPVRNDWLVVDTSDRPWNAVQDWYQEEVVQRDVDNWIIEHARMLEHAKTSAEKNEGRAHPLSGEWGMNWFYVNHIYQKWWQPILRWRGHLLVCAHEKKLVMEGERADDKELIQLYSRVGVRPEGQKHLSLPMHTVLRLTDTVDRGKHTRKFTSIKDKGREECQGKEWEDFVQDYLVAVAKWAM